MGPAEWHSVWKGEQRWTHSLLTEVVLVSDVLGQ